MLRATLRSLFARKLRLLLSAAAVVLGVTFVSSALTLTDTLGRVLDDLFTDVNAKTDVVVRGSDQFDRGRRSVVTEEALERVRGIEGVRAVAGDVAGYSQLVGRDGRAYRTGGAPTFGLAFDDNPATSPLTLREGRPPQGPAEVAVDAVTARATGYRVGERVRVVLSSGERQVRLSGVFGFGDNDNLAGASLLAFDAAAAQVLLGRVGQYDAVRVAAEPGVSPSQLQERIAAQLPPGVEAITGEQSSDETSATIQRALGFVNIVLLIFASVALFVGAFLIFNTFSILVAQRSRELALLRALGASRGQVMGSVLLEAVLVGAVASVVGVALGVAVASGLRALAGRFGAALPAGPLVVAPRTVVVGLAVGVVITALAALLPARKASAVPPVAAMREAATSDVSLRRTTVIGLVLLAPGLAALGVGLTGSLRWLGGGAALSFLGIAALSPLLSRPVTGALGRPLARGVPGRLGRRNAMRNPARTASTAAALMIGLALVSTVSVLGESAKASVEKVVETVLGADLVIQQRAGFQGLPTSVADRLQRVPGVAAVDRLREANVQVDGSPEQVTAVSAGAVGRTLSLTAVAGSLADLDAGKVLVAASEAAERRLSPGDTLVLGLPNGQTRLVVAGTYVDNQLAGSFLVDLSLSQAFVDRLDTVLLVKKVPEAAAGDVRRAVDAAAAALPTVQVQDRTDFVAEVSSRIQTVTTIITVLLALSVLIAVLGVVNTLALSVLERTRELGLLRAVGLSRAATRRMVTVEAVVVAVFGGLLGVVVGGALGVAFQRALVEDGITELRLPLARLALFVVFAACAGVLAALLPARRAARLDVLAAIAAR